MRRESYAKLFTALDNSINSTFEILNNVDLLSYMKTINISKYFSEKNMNLKKLVSFSMLLVLLAFVGMTNAATYYVNNSTGNNANGGTTPATAVRDINVALTVAPAGSTIEVVYTGFDYTLEPNPLVVNANYTFTSSGGNRPIVTTALSIGGSAVVTFTGPLQFNFGLVLNSTAAPSAIVGGNNLFLGNSNAGADITITLGTVSGQLNYVFTAGAGTFFNFLYNGAVGYTTGAEMPAAGVTNVIGDLTTAAGVTPLTLGSSKTMNGILTTGSTLAIGASNTLQIVGNNAHVIGGNVTGGTMQFDLPGTGAPNVSLTGIFDVPNIVANCTNTAGADGILTIVNAVNVGNVTANGDADVFVNNSGTLGNLLLTGDGPLTVLSNGTVGTVTASSASTGNINLNAAVAYATGTITQSGFGTIQFGAPVSVTVNGNVLLNSIFPAYTNSTGVTTNLALIIIPNVATTINGNVTNQARFSGTGDDNHQNLGNIYFNAAANNVAITGDVTNSVQSTLNATGGTTLNNGNILFAFTGPGTFTVRDIINEATVNNGSASVTGIGSIPFTGAGFGVPVQFRNIINRSTLGALDFNNGDINLNPASTGTVTVTQGISQSGAQGGDIILGTGALNVTGSVLSSRTVAGANILTTLGAGAGLTVGGDVINSGLSTIQFGHVSAGAAVPPLTDVTISGKIENNNTGTITFPNVTTATFGFGSIVLTKGTIVLGGAGTAPTSTITCPGLVNLASGTLNFGGPATPWPAPLSPVALGPGLAGYPPFIYRPVTFSGANITIGDPTNTLVVLPATAVPGIYNMVEITLAQPIPNVPQTLTIGGTNTVLPCALSINNPANILPPVVTIKGGYLTLQNNFLINNSLVPNSVLIDGARIYVGDRSLAPINVAMTNGNFFNLTGYTTANGGFVMMNGANPGLAQEVNGNGGAATGVYNVNARFGNFGVDNTSGLLPAVNFGATAGPGSPTPCVFTNDFYLAQGQAGNVNVVFDGPSPYPTIVRNIGVFAAAPTFTSLVNVVYNGQDKTTSWEIPLLPIDKLQNLTVSTSTGLPAGPGIAGQGIVTLGAAAKVNGTLTVDKDQTLYINSFNLTLAGPSAVINGYVDNDGTGQLVLAATGGTAITTNVATPNGMICDVTVMNNSQGNTIGSGIVGIGSNMLGDGAWNTAPNTFEFDGDVFFENVSAAGPSSLAVSLPAVVRAAGAGNFMDLTTQEANDTFTLNSNIDLGGVLTHGGGILNLQNFTLALCNTTHAMTEGARIIGNDLLFPDLNQDYTLNLTSTSAAPTVIEATVNFDMGTVAGPAASLFTFGGDDLELQGTVNLLSGQVDIPTALDLILSGLAVNVSSTYGFNTIGTGLVISDVAAAGGTQVLTSASTTIGNFEIADNLTLMGGIVNGTLTTNNLEHSGGLLTFGTADLVVNNSFLRSGNTTYSGDGWLIYNGAGGFQQGPTPGVTTPMVINNFETDQNFTLQATNTNNLVVVDELWLNNAAITNQIGGVGPGYLHVGDATTLPVVHATGGGADILGNAIVTDNGQIDYLFDGAGFTATNLLWPQSVANDVELDMNTAATALLVNSNRTIAGDLDLTTGILQIPTGVTVNMPTPGSDISRTGSASIVLAGSPAGHFTAADVDLFYSGTLTGGVEYSNPTIVRDVNLAAGAVVTLQNARTIEGNLALNGAQLNLYANTTFSLLQNIGNGTIDVGTVANPASVYFNLGAVIGGTLNVNGASHTAHYGQVFVPAGGLVVNGSLFNDGYVEVTDALTINGLYDGTNGWDDVLVDHVNVNGTVLLGYGNSTLVPPTVGSIWTVYGTSSLIVNNGGTFNSVGVTPVPATATPSELYLAGDLTVNAGGTFIGQMLNLFSDGTTGATYTLNGGATFNDWNVVKGANVIINVNNGNVAVNGLLNLVHGIVNVQTPFVLSLTPTTAFMFDHYVLTDLGYTRTPAALTDWAHIVGNTGIFVRENVEGRIEYPLGALNGDFRSMAITFTTSNRTITPTTIIASHFDTDALGVVNFPINGGTKFYNPAKTNWISSRAPYYWRVYATTALGASQLFNVELLGTEVHRPFETVNDLRIIRRFDGNVQVNGWYLQGEPGNYSNIMQLDIPAPGDTNITVRNINSQGGIVTQAALFTIGIPSQAPRFTNVLANTIMNEGDPFSFDYDAVDDDVTPDPPIYSLVINPATAHASINSSTGLFTFNPDFTEAGVYTVTVQAAKGGEPTIFSQTTATITVNNVNRAPVIVNQLGNTTIDDSQVLNFTYTATDADSDPLTWNNLVVNPAFAGTANLTAGGVLTFDPSFADAGKQFTVTVQVTDGTVIVPAAAAIVTVEYSRLKGDVDNNDLVQAFDASLVLQTVVGMRATPAAGSEDFWATDADANLAIGAYDAYYILYYVTNGVYPDLSMPKAIASGNVDFGSLSRVDEEVVSIPVKITNTSNVLSAQISLNIDASVASVDQIVSNLPKGWIMAHNFADGKLNIAMTGMNPIEDGNIVAVNLKLKNKEAKFDVDGTVTLNDNSEIALAKASVRQIPTQYELSQNYPNPFNPSTTIKYALATDSRVSIHIYNMLGEKVRTLVNSQQEAGYYNVQWDGSNDYNQKVSSGIYIYRLEAGSFVQTKKMNLIK